MTTLPYYMTWQNQSDIKGFELEKYDGVYFCLENGKKVLDLSSTSFHTSFGGQPQAIVSKVIESYKVDSCACPKGITKKKKEITEKLLDFMGKPQGKIYYTLSGSESVENALKIARQVSGKKTVAARSRSYHGSTLGAITATGDWRNQGCETPEDWSLRIPEPYEDPSFTESARIMTEYGVQKIAAVIIEPISAANGVIIPSKEWLLALQNFCKDNEIYLIYDEVCTGFYRTGVPFAYQLHPGLEPDIICLGKNISGGVFPFGAVWTNPKIAEYFNKNTLVCGSTNYAHPGGLAALDGVIDVLSDQLFVDSLTPLIQTFKNGLNILKKNSSVKEIRQIGLFAAIELNKNVKWEDFIHAGVFMMVKPDLLVLAPPYVISSKELLSGLKQIESVIGK